jgi:hypothetical protein
VSRPPDAIVIERSQFAPEIRDDIETMQSCRTARGVQLASRMEEPFVLRRSKWSRVVLALVGVLWLSIGIVSAMYVARSISVAPTDVVAD